MSRKFAMSSNLIHAVACWAIGSSLCATQSTTVAAPLDDAIAYWQFTGTGGAFPDPDLRGGQSPLASLGFVGNQFTVNNAAGSPTITALNSDQTVGRESAAPPFSFAGVDMSGVGQELVPTINTSYSVFARVRYGAFAGVDDMVRAGNWSSAAMDYYALETVSGQARFEVRGAGAGAASTVTHGTTLNTNTWYDVTGVYNSATQSMSVSVYDPLTGLQVGTSNSLGSLGFTSLEAGSAGSSTRNFLVFESPSNANGTNTGAEIDMAAVWNRALSASEIAQLSAGPAPLPEPASAVLCGLGALVLLTRPRRQRTSA